MKRLISVIGIICLSIVTFLNILYTAYLDNDEHIEIFNNSIFYVLGIILLGFFIIFITNFIDKKLSGKDNEIKRKRIFKVAIIIYTVINILWLLIVNPLVVGDQTHVCNIAQWIYNDNLEDYLPNLTYAEIPLSDYMHLYKQQISLSFIYSIFFRAIKFDIMESLRILNLIGNIAIIFALYKISNQLSKKYQTNKTRLMFFILTFASVIMLSTFIYGDIPSIALGLFSVYYMMKYIENKEIKFAIYSSICMMFAYMMRMNILIFIIATVLYLIFNFFKNIRANAFKENLMSIAIIIMYIVISIFPAVLVQNYYINKYNLDKEKNYPITSYFLMAMSESHRGYGWYDEKIGEYALKNPEKASEEYTDRIKDRLGYFLENKGEALDFYKKKITSMWAENTYSAVTNNIVKENDPIENVTGVLTFYQKTLLIVMCICAITFLIQNRKNLTYEIIFLLMIFIGGFLFHILWEAKSRYILPYIIILIPLASLKLKGKKI